MTKVESLKKLYAKLGGTASDVANIENIADMVDKVADIAENGGGSASIFVHHINFMSVETGTVLVTITNTSSAEINTFEKLRNSLGDKAIQATGAFATANDGTFLVYGISKGTVANKIALSTSATADNDTNVLEYATEIHRISASDIDFVDDYVEQIDLEF